MLNFIIGYFFLILVIAKIANVVSRRWPKIKEHWAIRTFEAFYPGFESQKEAEEYAKSKGWLDAKVIRLAN